MWQWTELEAPAPSTPKFLALSDQMESSVSSCLIVILTGGKKKKWEWPLLKNNYIEDSTKPDQQFQYKGYV